MISDRAGFGGLSGLSRLYVLQRISPHLRVLLQNAEERLEGLEDAADQRARW